MIRKLMLAAALLMAIPLTVGAAHGAACQPWNAWSPAQHHKVGPVDVAGGHGYGSGFHDAAHRSPPQPKAATSSTRREPSS